MNAKYIKTKLTQAFSLVELMVVVAIIALLTAIAVPSYKTYIAQSYMADIFAVASDQMTQQLKAQALSSAGAFSGAIAPNVTNTGFVTSTSGTTGTVMTTPSGLPGGVTLTNGWVGLQFPASNSIDPMLNNLRIYWVPTYAAAGTIAGDQTDTTITWTCLWSQGSVSGNSGYVQATVQGYLAIGNSGTGCTAIT